MHIREDRPIIKAITFGRSGIFVNPSRAAPYHVKPAAGAEDQRSCYALIGNATNNFQYAVFTSVIAVGQTNLHDADPSSMFRQVSGTLCTLEWERLCAFFCMVFKEPALHAQIYEDALAFSSRARPKEGSGKSSCTLFDIIIKSTHRRFQEPSHISRLSE
jgi:hypothetical protein